MKKKIKPIEVEEPIPPIPEIFYTESKSINDMVFVTLTDDGVQVLLNHYKKYTPSQMFPSEITGYNPKFQTLKTELWHLMHVFGEKMHMGGKTMFLHNQIGFVVDPFKI